MRAIQPKRNISMNLKTAKSVMSGAAAGRAVLRCPLRVIVRGFREGWLDVCFFLGGGGADFR